ADGELGVLADPAVDLDRAAVLLGHDVVADRQTKPGAFAGRLRREERLEQLVPDLRRYADTVVADADLDRLAEITGRDRQTWVEVRPTVLALPLDGGVEPIADQVDEHTAHLLRHQVDVREIAVVVAVARDVEVLVLGARA